MYENPAKTGKDSPLCIIQSGRSALFLACRPLFFIRLLSRIHPGFAAIYADLSGNLGDFILMKSGELIKINGKGCLDGWGKGILTEGCGSRDEIVNQKK